MKYIPLAIFLFAISQVCAADDAASQSKDAASQSKKTEITGEELEVHGATLGRMGDSAVVNPKDIKFSEAESRLWRSNHLKNIKKPGRLYYKFHKTGTYEKGFDDSVYLDILKINKDGTKDTDLEFFTGPRRQPVAPSNVTGVKGNPVLGIYLQGDIIEMNRLTHGSWRYFQHRIKSAFANNAKVEPVTIKYKGDKVKAEKITIQPYLHDPHQRAFGKFADKKYEFILSQQIPGSIYEIKTVVPDKSHPDGKPLIMEKLTFQRADFKS
ncbi:MAG: hypothetical protein P8126_05165 [Gammaproteobacteria bacterium]